MRDHGFTVVRTYTLAPDPLLDAAQDHDLQVLSGVFWRDWRYLLGSGRRERRRLEREAERSVRVAAQRLTGNDHVVGLCLGNEVPADVIRWFGPTYVSRTIGHLAQEVRGIDASRLVTYGNYPTAEYLPLDELDFLTFNVFLERQADLRRYLTRLHHLAAGRPLVIGELGADASGAGGEIRQALSLDWQIETAIERGVAGLCVFSWTDDWWVAGASVDQWRFGLTRADRTPRAALDVARRWNGRSVADVDFPWPSVSVVICAYNAAETLEECLRHVCALEYPWFEVIVVDDGSSDETAAIAARQSRVRLLRVPHAGLSVARNEGFHAASGELVAYLDADAYPGPEWLYYLALGMDTSSVGAVGGPNLTPAADPIPAQRVARAPGGPAHVLVSDDRAEHVPGCNMAFWREVLVGSGGFDPIYTSAGDDVDLCWRVLDSGWEIAFHPAAFVWHHPRRSTRAYLRQQRGYGRSEALVAARHPDRFSALGAARWRGSIYGGGRSTSRRFSRQRIYRGPYGSAAYQSVYRGGSHFLDLAHQVAVPMAWLALTAAPLVAIAPYMGAIPAFGVAILLLLGLLDALRCTPPPRLLRGRASFRAHVAALHLLQPLARMVGRSSRRSAVVPSGSESPTLPRVTSLRPALALLREDRPRPELVSIVVARLRATGLRVVTATGWQPIDARTSCSALLSGALTSSSHPPGWVQVRIRCRPRWVAVIPVVLATALLLGFAPVVGAVLGFCVAAESAYGLRRLRRTFSLALSEEVP